jgi:hypothetical protein
MAAIYSNGGNRWNILGFSFTKRDALSSVYKISMYKSHPLPLRQIFAPAYRHTKLENIFLGPVIQEPVNFGNSINLQIIFPTTYL